MVHGPGNSHCADQQCACYCLGRAGLSFSARGLEPVTQNGNVGVNAAESYTVTMYDCLVISLLSYADQP